MRVESLLSDDNPANRRGGPAGRLRQVFEKASELPRNQQIKVAEFVEAFADHYGGQRAAPWGLLRLHFSPQGRNTLQFNGEDNPGPASAGLELEQTAPASRKSPAGAE